MPVVVSTHISDNINDNSHTNDLNHHNQQDEIPTTICAFENSVISKVPIFKSVIESTNQLKNLCETSATVVNDTPENNNDENEPGEVRNLLLLTTRNSGDIAMVESELRKSQSDDVVGISRELIYNNPSVITSGLSQSRLLQNNNNNNRYDNSYASGAIMVNPNANRFGNYTIHFPNASSGIHQAFNASAYSWAHDLSIKSSDIVTKEQLEKVQNNNNNNNDESGDDHSSIHHDVDKTNNNHYTHTIVDNNTHGIEHHHNQHDNNNHHENHNMNEHHHQQHHQQHINSHHNSPSNGTTIVNNISSDSASVMRSSLLTLPPYSNYVDHNGGSSGGASHVGGSTGGDSINDDNVNANNTQQQSTIDEVIANTLEGEHCALDSHQLAPDDDGQHHHYITLSTANDLHHLKETNNYNSANNNNNNNNNHSHHNHNNSTSSCGDSRSPSGYSHEDFEGEMQFTQLVSVPARNTMFSSGATGVGGMQHLGSDHSTSILHSSPYDTLHTVMPSR